MVRFFNSCFVNPNLVEPVTSLIRDGTVRIIGKSRVAGVDAGRARKQVQIPVRRVREHRVQKDVVKHIAGIAVVIDRIEHPEAPGHVHAGVPIDVAVPAVGRLPVDAAVVVGDDAVDQSHCRPVIVVDKERIPQRRGISVQVAEKGAICDRHVVPSYVKRAAAGGYIPADLTAGNLRRIAASVTIQINS